MDARRHQSHLANKFVNLFGMRLDRRRAGDVLKLKPHPDLRRVKAATAINIAAVAKWLGI